MPQAFGFAAGLFGFGMGTAGIAVGTAAAGGWYLGAAFGSTVIGGLAAKLLTTVAISALQAAVTKKASQGGGLTINTTLRGEQNPETIIFGKTATSGQAICPPYSHGPDNVFLTHVIELCSEPGATLERMIIGDDYVELGPDADPNGYGCPVLAAKYQHKGRPLIYVRYYDGSQTTADPMLRDKYGSHPDRPWTAEMVGHGLCYAILTFVMAHKAGFTQVPRYRFEMRGAPRYDIRKDSTAGGSGAHRLNNPATWEQTDNPIVQAWSIFHGIALPGGEIWGGQVAAQDLPPADWMAAMNLCDVPVELGDGGSEPAYRAGLEVALTQEPASALTEILKAATAQVADCGGIWRIRAGAPALPVYSFTDDDVLVSKPQELDPFPALADTYNAVAAQYPEPEELWETKDAPPRHNAEWEAADRFGRRTADLVLPAVPYAMQVQRLMRAWIEAERRFARHIINLPPDATILDPLDTAAWASQRNGYAGKDFEISEVVEDVRTCVVQVSTREVDPEDYDWSPSFALPWVPGPTGSTPPPALAVSGFAVHAVTIKDAGGADRRPAIRLVWDDDIQADGIRWEIRLAGASLVVLRGTTQDLEAGEIILVEGLLPATEYEVRASPVIKGPDEWTGWLSVTTLDVRLTAADVSAIDHTPPASPTDLALTSVLLGQRVVLRATWAAPADADLAYHDISLTEGGGNPVLFVTSGSRYEWPAVPGVTYTVAVRAVDAGGNASAWTAPVAHTAVGDTTPPAIPTGLTATGGFEAIWLEWAANAEADLSHYELFEAETATPDPTAGTTDVIRATSTRLARTGLPAAATTRHYWIRAVDTSGNKSGWSARVQGQTVALQTGNLTGLIDEGSFQTGVEPVRIIDSGPLPTSRITGYIQHGGVLYKWSGSAYVPVVSAAELDGLILAGQIDARGLNILDIYGDVVFSATGEISPAAYITSGGNTISLSSIAANSLTPSVNFVGEFAAPPTAEQLGELWRQNALYKNTVDGKSYILTGSPLAWMQYLSDGNAFYLTIESTNGTIFRPGQASTTLLKARLFKNGAEVTDETPAGWFRWRRISAVPADDPAWNAAYLSGFKQVDVNIDAVHSRATFFCDVISS
ncbi:phage tail protein [Ruixingdingia sedimenti]|uniref:Phage tail protein n=1 Tax=Ruixingdingia sedimenti TaxID=3073604 RepID=A0ABU1FEN5_9RHOB|nr:phage tail protein [Xinfangfangia sp. LG-4]MDR5655369.1 phage tail protein [Xinfangfangia sp. LG-4]